MAWPSAFLFTFLKKSKPTSLDDSAPTFEQLGPAIVQKIVNELDVTSKARWKQTSVSNNELDDKEYFKLHIAKEFGNIHWEQCYDAMGVNSATFKEVYEFLYTNIRKPLDQIKNKDKLKKILKWQRFYDGRFDHRNILEVATCLGCDQIVNEVLNLFEKNSAAHLYLDSAIKMAIACNNPKLLRKYLEKYQQNKVLIELQLRHCFQYAEVYPHSEIYLELTRFKIIHRISDVPYEKKTIEYLWGRPDSIESIELLVADEIAQLKEKQSRSIGEQILVDFFEAINSNNLEKITNILSNEQCDINKLRYLDGYLTIWQLLVILKKPNILENISYLAGEYKESFKIDIEQKNKFDQTTLDLAICLEQKKCIEVLQPIGNKQAGENNRVSIDLKSVISQLKNDPDINYFSNTVIDNLNDLCSEEDLQELPRLLIDTYFKFHLEFHEDGKKLIVNKLLELLGKNKSFDLLIANINLFSKPQQIQILKKAIALNKLTMIKNLLPEYIFEDEIFDQILKSKNHRIWQLFFSDDEVKLPFYWRTRLSVLSRLEALSEYGVDFFAYLNSWYKKLFDTKVLLKVHKISYTRALIMAVKRDDVDEFQKLINLFPDIFYKTHMNHYLASTLIDAKAKRILLHLLNQKSDSRNHLFKEMLNKVIRTHNKEMLEFLLKNSGFTFQEMSKFDRYDRLCAEWYYLVDLAFRNKNLDAFEGLVRFIGQCMICEDNFFERLLKETDSKYIEVFLKYWPVYRSPLKLNGPIVRKMIGEGKSDHLIAVINFNYDKGLIKDSLWRTIFSKAIIAGNPGLYLLDFLFKTIKKEQLVTIINSVNSSKMTLLGEAIKANNYPAVRTLLKHGANLVVAGAKDALQIALESIQQDLLHPDKVFIVDSVLSNAKKLQECQQLSENISVLSSFISFVEEKPSIDKIKSLLPTDESQILTLAKLLLRTPEHLKELMIVLPEEIEDKIKAPLAEYCAKQFRRAVSEGKLDYANILLGDKNPIRNLSFGYYQSPQTVMSFLFGEIVKHKDVPDAYYEMFHSTFRQIKLNEEQFKYINKLFAQEFNDHPVMIMRSILRMMRTQTFTEIPKEVSKYYATAEYYENYFHPGSRINMTAETLDSLKHPDFDPCLTPYLLAKCPDWFFDSMLKLVMQGHKIEINSVTYKYMVNNKHKIIEAFNRYLGEQEKEHATEKLKAHHTFYGNDLIKSIIDEHRYFGFFKETTATHDKLQEQQATWETLARQTEARQNFGANIVGPR